MASGNHNQGSNWIRREKRLAIYARDDYRCMYCQTDLAGDVATLDHVAPRELGGGNETTNLVTACLSCNSSKRALSVRNFLVILRDHGVETEGVAARVRRQTRRALSPL